MDYVAKQRQANKFSPQDVSAPAHDDTGPFVDISIPIASRIWWPFIFFSQWCQAVMLSCGYTGRLLKLFYYIDFFMYSSNRLSWLETRRKLFGPVFCGLGRLNFGGYQEVATVLSNPQRRSDYLGRAQMDQARLPNHFLLFEHTLPGETLHDKYRDAVTEAVFTPECSARSTDAVAAALTAEFGAELHAARDPALKTVINGTVTVPFPKQLIADFVLRWMHYAVLGIEVSKEEPLMQLLRVCMSDQNYVTTRLQGIGGLLHDEEAVKRYTTIERDIVTAYLERAPLFTGLPEGATIEGMPPRAFARYILAMIAMAAILGGINLVGATLAQEIEAIPVPIDDASKLQNFVLEAARRFCPVNLINVLLLEPQRYTICCCPFTFPTGTLLGANIAMGTLDAEQFECPHRFRPNRPAMATHTLNFNSVGLAADETDFGASASKRACLGRFLAVEMSCSVLRAFYTNQGVEV